VTEDAITALAVGMMGEHGLIDRGWEFRFEDSLPSSAGPLLGHTSLAERRIRLARDYALSRWPDQIRATMLHEIAHALAGEEHYGHGPGFQAKLEELRHADI
jgi:hypothetical protein